jgi:hypothetical protein
MNEKSMRLTDTIQFLPGFARKKTSCGFVATPGLRRIGFAGSIQLTLWNFTTLLLYRLSVFGPVVAHSSNPQGRAPPNFNALYIAPEAPARADVLGQNAGHLGYYRRLSGTSPGRAAPLGH